MTEIVFGELPERAKKGRVSEADLALVDAVKNAPLLQNGEPQWGQIFISDEGEDPKKAKGRANTLITAVRQGRKGFTPAEDFQAAGRVIDGRETVWVRYNPALGEQIRAERAAQAAAGE